MVSSVYPKIGWGSPVPELAFLTFHSLYASECFGTVLEGLFMCLPWPSPSAARLGSLLSLSDL